MLVYKFVNKSNIIHSLVKMKAIIILSVFLAVAYAAVPLRYGLGGKIECLQNAEAIQRGLIEDQIRAKIEQLRTKLKEQGIPELGIDSLDPLVIENERIQLDTPFELDLNISQRTEGLLGFEITNLEVHLIGLKFDFTVNWPKVTTHNDYGLLAKVMDRELFGNGVIDATAENFAISGHGKVTNKLIGGKLHIQIEELSIQLSLGSFNFRITGFMNDDELSNLISDIITDAAPIAVQEAEKEINAGMAQLIKIINEWIVNNMLYEADLNPLAICN